MRRIAVVALCALALPRTAPAQDLEYTSTTQFSLSPSLGPMSGPLGGGRSFSSHVSVKGSWLRLDVGPASSIVDADRRQMMLLDHSRRTYRIMPLTEPRDTRADSLANAAGAVLTVQPTREVKQMNGVSARRTNIIVRVPARNAKAPRATDLIVVNELWTSDTNGIGRSYRRVARFADQFGTAGGMMFGMMAQNPRAGAALQKAGKAAAQVPGMPVRSIVTYGNIPVGSRFAPGMRFDTLMAVVTNLTGIRSASLARSLFEIPSGYREASM